MKKEDLFVKVENGKGKNDAPANNAEIILSNKNVDVKKLSKSIVVYHQMKSNLV